MRALNRNILLFGFIILLFAIAPYQASACGCGLALSDMKVFNDLKETQAYLLIDVKDANTYSEMPFFRMVSMDEPYNVTIVFPMDGIPDDVQGKTITAGDFLRDYGINDAEDYITRQSMSGVTKQIGNTIKDSSGGIFMLSNGLVVSILGTGLVGFSKSMNGAMDRGLVAHYDFEGGSLDIYDVNSMDSLQAFVDKLGMNLTGEVEDLVNKYKDYYVAVLYLKVPSVLDEQSRLKLKTLCPEETARVKTFLQDNTEISYMDRISLAQGACEAELGDLIDGVLYVNDRVNGTLVDMSFKNRDTFFYPTSIVNSYKYPITDQKYFIRVPSELHAQLETSKVDKIATFDSERWYKITSSKEDIKGQIVKASSGVKIGDFFRAITQLIYDGAGWITFLLYMVILFLPILLYHTYFSDNLSWKEVWTAIWIFLVGGFLISGIVMLVKKKRSFGLTLLSIWGILLVLFLVSKALS